MIVVSNASPIIALSRIRKLELLERLFNKILIPREVYNEIVSEKDYLDEVNYFKSFSSLFEIKDAKKKQSFSDQIGLGESAAINLALEKKSTLIIDEHEARIIANNLGIKIIGTLGLLLKSLEKKCISYDELVSLLNQLSKSGFRMSIELYSEILKNAKTKDIK